METIELVNDGTGLGFGIVGGKTTGVIVKTILPGGIADQVISSLLLGDLVFKQLHRPTQKTSLLRMAACAAGTTSSESVTLTCTGWAASKWPKSSGSVGTG